MACRHSLERINNNNDLQRITVGAQIESIISITEDGVVIKNSLPELLLIYNEQ